MTRCGRALKDGDGACWDQFVKPEGEAGSCNTGTRYEDIEWRAWVGRVHIGGL